MRFSTRVSNSVPKPGASFYKLLYNAVRAVTLYEWRSSMLILQYPNCNMSAWGDGNSREGRTFRLKMERLYAHDRLNTGTSCKQVWRIRIRISAAFLLNWPLLNCFGCLEMRLLSLIFWFPKIARKKSQSLRVLTYVNYPNRAILTDCLSLLG